MRVHELVLLQLTAMCDIRKWSLPLSLYFLPLFRRNPYPRTTATCQYPETATCGELLFISRLGEGKELVCYSSKAFNAECKAISRSGYPEFTPSFCPKDTIGQHFPVLLCPQPRIEHSVNCHQFKTEHFGNIWISPAPRGLSFPFP